jgi:hypothetical protein
MNQHKETQRTGRRVDKERVDEDEEGQKSKPTKERTTKRDRK